MHNFERKKEANEMKKEEEEKNVSTTTCLIESESFFLHHHLVYSHILCTLPTLQPKVNKSYCDTKIKRSVKVDLLDDCVLCL
jgi:hypothetical protein